LSIEPLEVEQWLKALKREEGLENPTLDKMRRRMALVYKHGQRYGLIPRNEESNPMRFVRCKTTSEYEAMILSPEQAFAVMLNLPEPERTLTLLAAVPVPVLTTALYERFSSRGEADFANKLLSAMRYQFGGHQEKSESDSKVA
jgi:hypothetical protein